MTHFSMDLQILENEKEHSFYFQVLHLMEKSSENIRANVILQKLALEGLSLITSKKSDSKAPTS